MTVMVFHNELFQARSGVYLLPSGKCAFIIYYKETFCTLDQLEGRGVSS